MAASTERAVLAGGCFWGMQDLVRRQPGVISTRVGYSGGDVPNATYRNHGTHAEAIEIVFDPTKTSYRAILEFFFQIHDPTTRNRQGNDIGASYRSAIFYANDEQKQVAAAYIAQLDKTKLFGDPIVTKLEPLTGFYPAEDYHQDFAVTHPNYPYLVFNDAPKVDNLKRLFPGLYRETPVTVLASNKPSE